MSLTKISNNSLSAISTLPASIPTGALTLLSTQTASSSASIEFTSGIDSTYSSYMFKFINIHPSNNISILQFNMSTDGGSTYSVTKTSTYFRALHNEGGTDTNLIYQTSHDLAQGTGMQDLAQGIGNDNDQCTVGTLQLFNPSSDTFVKHFISTIQSVKNTPMSVNKFNAGYINTITPITRVKFKFSSGNIDSGEILLFGVN